MLIYLISTFLLLLISVGKLFFMSIEGFKSVGILGITSFLILAGLLAAGSASFIRYSLAHKRRLQKLKLGGSPFVKIFLTLCLVVVGMSFYINFNKKILVWDSVALYDARAKFLMSGINFSQMIDLSRYDPQNSYYYILYPPHTSIIHHFWYKLGTPVPIGIYYSFLLLLLGVSVYLFTNKRLGPVAAIFLTFITVSNNTVFSTSLAEYTNTPFMLQFFIGVFLLADFLEDKQAWKFFYGTALVITSQWIRFLEPLWLGIVLAFFIGSVKRRDWRKTLIYPVFMGLYGFIEYGSWGSFISSFGEKTKIVSLSFIRFFEPLVGIFTGSALAILSFFIMSWGLILLIHLYALIGTVDKKMGWMVSIFGKGKERFFKLVFLFTLLIYYLGLYFVSFQSDWWDTLGGSLIRSSTFLIPISGYLILNFLVNKQKHAKHTKIR